MGITLDDSITTESVSTQSVQEKLTAGVYDMRPAAFFLRRNRNDAEAYDISAYMVLADTDEAKNYKGIGIDLGFTGDYSFVGNDGEEITRARALSKTGIVSFLKAVGIEGKAPGVTADAGDIDTADWKGVKTEITLDGNVLEGAFNDVALRCEVRVSERGTPYIASFGAV